jgi:hypothetical protein
LLLSMNDRFVCIGYSAADVIDGNPFAMEKSNEHVTIEWRQLHRSRQAQSRR